MKTLLLLGLLSFCAFSVIKAQDSENSKEIQVRDHIYKVITIEEEIENKSVWIERPTDRLRYLERQYEWVESMNISYDEAKMRELVKKHIVPLVKQSKLRFEDEDIFLTSIIFNMNGGIQEFAVSFPAKLDISMDIVDDLFNAVLSSGIKCTYKKDHPGLKNAQCIYGVNIYGLDDIQKDRF